MAIGAKNLTLIDFSQQFVHGNFWVLTNAKNFIAAYVIKIKRRKMAVISANNTPALGFNFTKQSPSYILKCTRRQFFGRRITSALRRAKLLPRAGGRKWRTTC